MKNEPASIEDTHHGYRVGGVPPGCSHRVLETPFVLERSAIECARMLDDAGWLEVEVFADIRDCLGDSRPRPIRWRPE